MNAEQLKRLEEIETRPAGSKLMRDAGDIVQISEDERFWLVSFLRAAEQENERLRKQIQADADTFEARLLAEIDATNDLLVVSEATCQSLLEQSSRWEAQALEAGARVKELEAEARAVLARRYREGAEAMQEEVCLAIGEDSEEWMLDAIGAAADRLLKS
jgi:hypothetical protein